MGSLNGMENADWLNDGNRHTGQICNFLSTLPPGSTVTDILVDDVSFAVSSFVNVNTDTNLAYFTSVTGTTLIVDCNRISQIIF
ncbi:hypothetical protein AB1K89_08255 [Sporosarcina sp. 179-K 8C2 HS]|uniref:hypothetical protein n=1 Tax=Sporosarcina sp. 179-K 8C2 HS TaxID=3142387 RepID=UPI0039A10D0D